MAFASDDDLVDMLPTVFDHGVATWQPQLDKAEADVVRKIQVEWYNKRYISNNFDQQYLTAVQWTNAVIYRALGYYILPQLSQWRPESDSFREQMEFYQARFAEEINDQFGIGIEYDYDRDGEVDQGEVYNNTQTRIYR